MTDLSTADLAGGRTTPRTEDRALDRDMTTDTTTTSQTLDGQPADGDALDRQELNASTTARPSDVPRHEQLDDASNRSEALFPTGEADGFRSRWQDVQTGFVDEPRNAVEQADKLVAEMMQRLAQVFADERSRLEEQWSRGDDISTEDLRQALRRYRSFFDRLLSV
jgi:predicted lipid-binding transport protein (Tim44 family)